MSAAPQLKHVEFAPSEVHPEIAEHFSPDALKKHEPTAWLLDGTNPPDAAYKEAEWSAEEMLAYVKAAVEMLASTPEEALKAKEIPVTPANVRALLIARTAVADSMRLYYVPNTGRPGISINAFLAELFRGAEKRVNKALSEDKPKEFTREVLEQDMQNIGANLEGIYKLLFCLKRADGAKSQGWSSEREKANFMKKLKELKSEDSQKVKLQKLWVKSEGEKAEFEAAWETWENKSKELAGKFQAKKAKEEPEAIGLHATQIAMQRIGVSNKVKGLIALGEKHAKRLQGKIDEIEASDPEEIPAIDSRAKLQDLIEKIKAAFQKVFVDSGLLPVEGAYDPEVLIGGTTSSYLASTSTDGRVNVREFKGNESDWLKRGANLWRILIHELTHNWQILHAVPNLKAWESRSGWEIGVQPSEIYAMTQIAGFVEATGATTNRLIVAKLKADLRMALNAVAALKFHSGEISWDGVKTDVEKVPDRDGKEVTRVMTMMATGPDTACEGWISSTLFAAWLQTRDLSISASTYRIFIEETGGVIPAHFFLPWEGNGIKVPDDTQHPSLTALA
ncbi:hypothetical protein HOD30_04875 [Candidatus Peregrinibacteria bacterium]|jgi:hypothetical protein|nr:hypothetical protein [Candidatus Peregrinibacteria bacterium]MBT4631730.1 hypothetical protein [Candidatus Peregrinibacteria bacterium]MBT5517253.1 hypothetical protein [Candidatus Peregrinibacteria bacterium]MBT5824538.1 hypothetical protein [Candidatus Peregrinibacteria bacterium]